MKTRIDNASDAYRVPTNFAPTERRNDALTDAQLEVVTAAGGGAGVNPSRTGGLAGRSV